MPEKAPKPQTEQQPQINWDEAFDFEARQAREEAERQEQLRLQEEDRQRQLIKKSEDAYFKAREAGNDESKRYEESMPPSNEELDASELLGKFAQAEVAGDKTIITDTEELIKEKIEAGEFDGEKFSKLAQVAGYAEVRGNAKTAELIQQIVDKKITDEYNRATATEDYRVRQSRDDAPSDRTGTDDKSLARAKKYERYNTLKQQYADELRDTDAYVEAVESGAPVEPAAEPEPKPETPKSQADKDVTVKAEKTGQNNEQEKKLSLTVGEAELKLHGEDTILRDDTRQLYGVFDGMGGHINGEKASKAAAEATEKFYAQFKDAPKNEKEALDRIKAAMDAARKGVDQNGMGGSTTAVFTKFDMIGGKPAVAWANAGDSRLFIRNSSGEIKSVATDQSSGNIVFDGLHPGGRKDHHDPDEFGVIYLDNGDRIMICSDGITGDWQEQFLTEEEMKDGFNEALPKNAADKFLQMSKKTDDKSILVIDIDTDKMQTANTNDIPNDPQPDRPVASEDAGTRELFCPPQPPERPEQIDIRTDAEKLEDLEDAISLFNHLSAKNGAAFVPGTRYYDEMTELAKAIKVTEKGAIGYTAYGKKLNSTAARKFLDGLNPRKWILSDADTTEAKRIIDYNDKSIANGGNEVPYTGRRSKRNQLLDVREFNKITNKNGPIYYQVVSNYRDYVDNRLNLSEELKRSNPDSQPADAERHDAHTFVQQNKANLLQATRRAGRNRRLNLGGRAANIKSKISNGANRALDALDDVHFRTNEKISRKIEENDRQAMIDELTNTPVTEMSAKATEIKARDANEMKDTWTYGSGGATTRHKQFRDQVNNIVYKAEQNNR